MLTSLFVIDGVERTLPPANWDVGHQVDNPRMWHIQHPHHLLQTRQRVA
jgi:hypothetical protein